MRSRSVLSIKSEDLHAVVEAIDVLLKDLSKREKQEFHSELSVSVHPRIVGTPLRKLKLFEGLQGQYQFYFNQSLYLGNAKQSE